MNFTPHYFISGSYSVVNRITFYLIFRRCFEITSVFRVIFSFLYFPPLILKYTIFLPSSVIMSQANYISYDKFDYFIQSSRLNFKTFELEGDSDNPTLLYLNQSFSKNLRLLILEQSHRERRTPLKTFTENRKSFIAPLISFVRASIALADGRRGGNGAARQFACITRERETSAVADGIY